MPAFGVAWHYPRDSPETLMYNPARPMLEQQQHTVAQWRRTQTEEMARCDDRKSCTSSLRIIQGQMTG